MPRQEAELTLPPHQAGDFVPVYEEGGAHPLCKGIPAPILLMNFALEIIEGKQAGYRKVVTLPARVLIGRDKTCDVVITEDALLSRQHCLIEFGSQEIKVLDLKSRNGTYVNGARIEEKVLDLNDKIRIGRHIFSITPLSQPAISNASHVGTAPSSESVGVCNKCGIAISEVDIRSMKAIRHGNNLYCEQCLSSGIEIPTIARRRETRSDMPQMPPKGGIPIATMADFTVPPPISNAIPSVAGNTPSTNASSTGRQAKASAASIKKQETKPPPPMHIGHYEILEVLGEGGMGFVYKARHSFLETIVAIKVIKEELATQPDILKRFLREAKLGVTLRHPNIIQIIDAGEVDGIYFISMEYFESKDLNALVKSTKYIPYMKALNWSIQMAAGLNYAHKQGVIHRDVKPSNILVDKSDHIKVADFGLAKAWQKSGAHQLTASGQMLGTIQYISPEQLESSRTVDPRADLFSLGASIYFILTGIPPFGQEPLGKVIQNILHNNPAPMQDIQPDMPEEFESIILKALAKDPGDRYDSMESFYNALVSLSKKLQG